MLAAPIELPAVAALSGVLCTPTTTIRSSQLSLVMYNLLKPIMTPVVDAFTWLLPINILHVERVVATGNLASVPGNVNMQGAIDSLSNL